MKSNLIVAAVLAATAASCAQEPTPSSGADQGEQAQATQEPTSTAPPAASSALVIGAGAAAGSDDWAVGDTIPSGRSGVPNIEILEVRENGSGEACGEGKTATLAYKAMKANGEVLDPGSRPFTFRVGSGQAIVGWDKVVARMRVGDSFVILMPEALAYPGRGNLKFEMKLLSVR